MTDSPWWDQLIDEWRYAYFRANGKVAPPVVYDRGWFMIDGKPPRYRSEHIAHFRDELRRRVKPTESGELEIPHVSNASHYS